MGIAGKAMQMTGVRFWENLEERPDLLMVWMQGLKNQRGLQGAYPRPRQGQIAIFCERTEFWEK